LRKWIVKLQILRRRLLLACAVAALGCSVASAQSSPRNTGGRESANPRGTNQSDLVRLRADVIEKMKEARVSAQKLLEINQSEQNRLTEEHERRLELFRQGLIARADVAQSEHALGKVILRVDQDRRGLTEIDIAITEAEMRDELLRLPPLAPGGHSESATLVRFNGAALWSLAEVSKVERYFLQTFGRALPISALGQTPTHDRLRFDHRDAMDVALHPESKEGQSLLTYLRQAGIPFIAFKGAVPGSATGAHIHIGKASPRT
jgi:hypothetical protein